MCHLFISFCIVTALSILTTVDGTSQCIANTADADLMCIQHCNSINCASGYCPINVCECTGCEAPEMDFNSIVNNDNERNNIGMMPGPIGTNIISDNYQNNNDNAMGIVPEPTVPNINIDDHWDEDGDSIDMMRTTKNYDDEDGIEDEASNKSLSVITPEMTAISVTTVPTKWFTIAKTSIVCSIIILCLIIAIVFTIVSIITYKYLSKKHIHILKLRKSKQSHRKLYFRGESTSDMTPLDGYSFNQSNAV